MMAQATSNGSELSQAVSAGNADRVKNIIADARGSIEEQRLLSQGLTEACEQNQLSLVRELTSLGANSTRKTRNRAPPIIIAVKLGHADVLQHLLETASGDDAETKKMLQALPIAGLMIARHRSIMELLIKHNPNLDFLDKEGKTVLMNVRDPLKVELLLANGANVEAKDPKGSTALMNTLILDKDPAIASVLISKGNANINARDNEERTILMTAIWRSRIEVLKTLIECGADVFGLDKRGRTLLHHLASDRDRTYEYHAEVRIGRDETQQERDSRILQILLDIGIDPEATDIHGRTCLHWAAANKCSGLLKLLLRTGKFDINATEHRAKTPLHFATRNGDLKTVEVLLEEKSVDVNVESDGEWTALHCACWSKADSREVVRKLLDHGAILEKKTRSGRTALHIAADAGNLEIVRYLLDHTSTDRAPRDAFGNTPLLSGTRDSHRNRVELATLFAPWNHQNRLSRDAREAATKFDATIVDFVRSSRSKGTDGPVTRKRNVSVFRLLYGKDPEDVTKPEIAAFDKNLEPGGFRWIHIPASNISWCLDLFAKQFIEEGAVNSSRFKALERSFNHQHRGSQPQARYMTPLCQTIIQSGGSEESGQTADVDAEEMPSRKSTFNERIGQAAPDNSDVVSKRSPKDRVFRRKPRPVKLAEAKEPDMVPKSPHTPKESSKLLDDRSAITDFYVFMPYLHFETYPARQEMSEWYSKILASSSLESPPASETKLHGRLSNERRGSEYQLKRSETRDEALFRAYLNNSDQTLHIRRTLDQSFYHHINTKYRDSTQVIHRFQEKFDQSCSEPKVLMVDQLWMWSIDSKLIITSFPDRWKQPKKDPLNILDSILSSINSPSRDAVRDVYELAMMITERCYGAYDRHGVGSKDPQFLDMFEGWIGAAMDDEFKLFDYFRQDSAMASKWIQNPEQHLRDMKREQKRRHRSEPAQGQTFNVIESRPSRGSDFVENLLDIGSETELLGEIKDIQDELEMLSGVFRHQAQVLPALKNAIETISKQRNWPQTVKQKVKEMFEDSKRTILHPQRDINRMEKQAKRMYDSIRDLLDLKQKHAGAIQARYAREQTDDTSRQGQTLFIFTIFTVIFLPLSFIASLFAIDIRELPHTGTNQVLTMAFVAKYTFGIGAGIAILCVIVAVYLRDIPYWARLFKERLQGEEVDPKKTKALTMPSTPFSAPPDSRRSNGNLGPSLHFRGVKVQDLESG